MFGMHGKKQKDSYFNLEMHAFMLTTMVLSTAITERPMKDSSYVTSTTILQTVSCEHCTQKGFHLTQEGPCLTFLELQEVKSVVDCTHLHNKYE